MSSSRGGVDTASSLDCDARLPDLPLSDCEAPKSVSQNAGPVVAGLIVHHNPMKVRCLPRDVRGWACARCSSRCGCALPTPSFALIALQAFGALAVMHSDGWER